MKHPDDEVALARSLLLELDVELSDTGLELALDHVRWVLESRDRLNLTAVSDFDEAVRLHLVDSLTALPEVLAAVDGEMLDLGTGGGFPGVPLAIASSRVTVLLDSVRKKAEAVAEFVRGTQLPVRVVPLRSEEHAMECPERYAVVVARAVASLPVLVELAAPLLAESGVLVCLKGRPQEEEVERGDRAAAIVGLELVSRRSLALPPGTEHREILAYQKREQSSVLLPRRPGRAQKKPLA